MKRTPLTFASSLNAGQLFTTAMTMTAGFTLGSVWLIACVLGG